MARLYGVPQTVTTHGTKTPDVAQEILLLEDALGILGQGHEQLVLLRGKLHRLAAHGDDPGGEVDLEVTDSEPRVPRAGSPPQDRPHASDQLVVHEGTNDVVVAAAREAAHAVDRIAPGADHDHRHVPVPHPPGLALTKAAANLEAGSVGQHRIEEHEARLRLLEELEGRPGPVGREHLEPVVGQLLLEVGAERSLVLDDQNHSPDHGRRR